MKNLTIQSVRRAFRARLISNVRHQIMIRGANQWLKHFSIGALLLIFGMLLSVSGIKYISSALMFGGIIYALISFVGFVLRIGPLKYIGEMYIESAKEENARSKNPWEKDA